MSAFGEGQVEPFRLFLLDNFGLRFDDARVHDLRRSVRRAAEELRTSEEELGRLVRRRDPAAVEALVAQAVVSETYFFRGRPFFDALRKRVLPDVVASNAALRRVRIWCAGCATGEEAYSIAATALEALETSEGYWDVRVVGTDIDRRALRHAHRGIYRSWSFRDVSDHARARWFRPAGREYEVAEELRRMTEFTYANLVEPFSDVMRTNAFDVIACRNVLMYLDQTVARRVLDGFINYLPAHGWLLLGPTDPIPDHDRIDVEASAAGVMCRRRPTPVRLPKVEAPTAPRPSATTTTPRPPRRRPTVPRPSRNKHPGQRPSAAAPELDSTKHFAAGLVKFERGDLEGALEATRSALYLRPGFLAARCLAGILLARLGDTNRGRRLLEGVVESTHNLPPDERLDSDPPLTVGVVREFAEAQLSLLSGATKR